MWTWCRYRRHVPGARLSPSHRRFRREVHPLQPTWPATVQAPGTLAPGTWTAGSMAPPGGGREYHRHEFVIHSYKLPCGRLLQHRRGVKPNRRSAAPGEPPAAFRRTDTMNYGPNTGGTEGYP